MKHYGAGLAGIAQTEELRSLTGGTHAAVWLRHDGTVAFGREDVGRHVALDKLLGCRARTKEHDGALFVSSRASYEVVQKAAAAAWKSSLQCRRPRPWPLKWPNAAILLWRRFAATSAPISIRIRSV